LLVSIACESKKAPQRRKPNVVLINVDDLGWKDLGFMGSDYYDTPNLDALATEGMVFTNAYASAANCAPSRACMLSGLNTTKHGVYTVSPSDRGDKKTRKLIPTKNIAHLSDDLYTLPKMMKSAGYVTGSFGKWHIGKDPSKQGIDYNVGGSSKGNPGKDGYFAPYTIDNIENGPEGEYLTDRLTSETVSFIEKNKDTTFFLYIPFYTVHTPIMGKEALIEKYKSKQGKDGQDNPEYAAMVSSMDENVGRILKTLKTLNLEENTLLIFTSDNGGIRSISEQNPLRAGKGSYYEGGIRVPLVIKWPGKILKGSTNHNTVSNLDFYPTLQEVVAPVEKATKLDGVSLTSQFMDTTANQRDLYFHFPIYLQAYSMVDDDGRDPLFRTRPGSVIISGDYKLHRYYEDEGLELYNLKSDLGERNNSVSENPLKVEELQKKLNSWLQLENAPIPVEKNLDYDESFEKVKLQKSGHK